MKNPIIERPHPANLGGIQKIYRFSNGYGASVVQFPYSYGGDKGLWELAVIMFNSKDSDGYEITYKTPITDDVLGYLEESEIDDILNQIESLPFKGDL